MRRIRAYFARPAFLALVALPLLFLGSGLGQAEAPPRQDEVVLELSAEEWVETETATVVVMIDLAITAGNFGAARAEVERDLKAVSAKAPWRLTRFSKLRDEAGYERWRVLAEARLPGGDLSTLGPKVTGASRPGRGFRIQRIDYTPTRAEREAALAKLRARLYGLVGQELASINKAFPGRGFRAGIVDFTNQSMIGRPVMDAPRGARMMTSAAKESAPTTAVAEKLTVNARIILSANPPPPK
jgi:hypothetical protein